MSKETEAKIIEAIENAEEFLEPPEVLPDEFGEFTGEPLLPKGQRTLASFLVQLAAEFELFHTPDGTAHADINVDGHREIYRIDSDSFEQLLKHAFYKRTSEPAAPEAIRKARDLLEARAKYEGPTREVRVRVARLTAGFRAPSGGPLTYSTMRRVLQRKKELQLGEGPRTVSAAASWRQPRSYKFRPTQGSNLSKAAREETRRIIMTK